MMEGKNYMGAMILLLVGSVAISDARSAFSADVAGMRVCAGEGAVA